MGRTERSSSRRSGLLMGRPFGIPIYVTPSWLVIAAIITVLYEPRVEATLALGALSYLVAFVFAVLLYASVLIHELAHSVVARMYKLPVRRITLYMLGGVSEIEGEPQTPGREFWVAFSGPLLSFVLAGGGFALWLNVSHYTVLGVLVQQLWVANLLVAVFNMLPGLPLDGGRILRALVWALTRSPGAGTSAAAWAGRSIAVGVVALPFLFAWWAKVEPNVFAVLWAVLLASFMWMGATQSLRTARFKERLPGLRARELAHRAAFVSADTSVAEAERRMTESGAGAIVIVDSGGTPTSIVHAAAVAPIPEQRRPWMSASSVSRAVTTDNRLPVGLTGEDLLSALRRHPSSEYLVVEEDGSVHGVLRIEDVNRRLSRSER